jgi:hypothetical protein
MSPDTDSSFVIRLATGLSVFLSLFVTPVPSVCQLSLSVGSHNPFLALFLSMFCEMDDYVLADFLLLKLFSKKI